MSRGLPVGMEVLAVQKAQCKHPAQEQQGGQHNKYRNPAVTQLWYGSTSRTRLSSLSALPQHQLAALAALETAVAAAADVCHAESTMLACQPR